MTCPKRQGQPCCLHSPHEGLASGQWPHPEPVCCFCGQAPSTQHGPFHPRKRSGTWMTYWATPLNPTPTPSTNPVSPFIIKEPNDT